MKRAVFIIIALFLAAALVAGVLYQLHRTYKRRIDAAIVDLESSDREVVQSAIKFLSQSQYLYTARRLAETLASLDGSSPAKAAVMEAIQKNGPLGLNAILDVLTADPQTLPEEMRLEGNRRRGFMNDAKTIVRKMGGEAIRPLISLVGDPLWGHRGPRGAEVGAQLLGETGDRKALGILVGLLCFDETETVRIAAAESLGVLGTRGALGFLVSRIHDDPDIGCRVAVVRAIGQIANPRVATILLEALEDENLRIRRAAVEELGATGDPRTLGAPVGREEEESLRMHRAVVRALMGLGDPRVTEAFSASEDPGLFDIMLEAVDDSDAVVRWTAIDFLVGHGDERVIEPLLSAYERANDVENEKIAVALARLDPPLGVPLLVEIVNNGDKRDRSVQLMMLTQIDHPVVTDTMIEFLTTGDAELRNWAAHNVGAQRDERAIGPLLEALEDPDRSLQYSAFFSLEYFPTPEVIARIVELYDSFDSQTQFHAVYRLARMNTTESLEAGRELAGDGLAEVAENYKALIATGSEDDLMPLAGALWLHGTLEMAIDYTWCLEPAQFLASLASEWAEERECSDALLSSKDSAERPKWGSAESGE